MMNGPDLLKMISSSCERMLRRSFPVWLGVLVVLSVGISMGQDTTSTLKAPISPAMRPALPGTTPAAQPVVSAPAPQAEEAGPVSVEVSLNRMEAQVGEPLQAQVRVRWNASVKIPPIVFPAQVGEFEIQSQKEAPDVSKGENAGERTVSLQIAAFETGEQVFGPLEVVYSAGGETALKAESNSVTVQVHSVLTQLSEQGKETSLRPIKDPMALPFAAWPWVVLALVALVLLAVLLIWYFKRPSRKTVVLAPPPLPEPDEEALHDLAEIESSGMLQKAPSKELYSRMSEILRRYLGRRYRFDALEMTSNELLDTMEALGWSSELYRLLRVDLNECDSVKFARYTPGDDVRRAALARAREIVTRTRPSHTPPPVVAIGLEGGNR
jgi:hypothetical protein